MAEALPETQTGIRCAHFGPCGGCQFLDRPYGEELGGKAAALGELLVQALGPEARAAILPPLAARQPHFSRTAIKVPFGFGRHGVVAGFFRPGSHRIVDVHECAIQHPVLTALLVRARALASELDVPIYREHIHKGLLRHLLARVAPGTGEVLAGLVVRRAGAPQVLKLAEALYREFKPQGLVGVVENINPDQTSAIHGERSLRLCGRPLLEERQDGLRWRTSITSFVQVNAAQASRLYAEVLAFLGRGGPLAGARIAELFAGYGPIALRLAAAGARVTAIERHPAAVGDGIAAARLNGLQGRLRFLRADALVGLRRLDADGLDALVVDPPRRGLGPDLCGVLRGLDVPRLVYVSCNPETLARDLAELKRSFALVALRPVDLFPRTPHLEAVALLERRREG